VRGGSEFRRVWKSGEEGLSRGVACNWKEREKPAEGKLPEDVRRSSFAKGLERIYNDHWGPLNSTHLCVGEQDIRRVGDDAGRKGKDLPGLTDLGRSVFRFNPRLSLNRGGGTATGRSTKKQRMRGREEGWGGGGRATDKESFIL